MKTLSKRGQQGVIFLALVLVLLVTGSAFAISALNNRQTTSLARGNEVRYQMEQTKAALLAYTANYATFYDHERGPGFFPCPDTDLEGTPDYAGGASGECTYAAPAIGRLPELEVIANTTYRFNDTYADVDQQFWYVVAPRYLYSGNTDDRRSYTRTYADPSSTVATANWLTLDGETKYVALIIAPGEELESQNRLAGPDDYRNYLDGQNGNDGANFYTSFASDPEQFNDQILGITHDEYMIYVGTVVAREVKTRFDAYYQNFPYYPLFARRYPATSGSLLVPPSTTCNTSTSFSNLFDNTAYGSASLWLRDSSTGNNSENWSCTSGLYWNRLSYTEGELRMNGCSGLVFRIEYGASLVREGESCQ